MTGEKPQSIYDFSVRTIDGEEISLASFRGKILLIVNVASQCGFTKQYAELQQLFEKYSNQGLMILAFPCNQFAHQEPGDEAEINNFCQTNYHVQFPLFAKINVNGANAHPLYQFLKRKQKGILGSSAIKWNFTKFLVSPEGKVLQRFAPQTTRAKIEPVLNDILPI